MRAIASALVTVAALGGPMVQASSAAGDTSIPCPRPVAAASTDSFDAEVTCTATGDGSTVQGTSFDGSTFTFKPICEKDQGSVNPQVFGGCTGQLECGENGIIYTVTITRPGGAVESYNECFDTPRRRPGVREVAAAFADVPVPSAAVRVQPPGGRTLVNLPTVMSTVAEPFEASVDLRGYVVTFTITPATFAWHHGDGTSQATSDPGRPWHQGDEPTSLVHHVYVSTASGLGVRVDTTWTATWSLDGVDQGPVDGAVTSTGTPVSLDVVEAAPQLVLR